MKRRTFIKNSAILGGSLSLAGVNQINGKDSESNPTIKKIKPKRLKKGDTVGLIAPAGYVSEKRRHIQRWRLEPGDRSVLRGGAAKQRESHYADQNRKNCR